MSGTHAAIDPASLLARLPPVWPQPLLPGIRRRGGDRTLVVLDDDPTGTQTVRNVRVLIEPSTDDLARTLAARPRVVFILTNSRALPRDAADRLARRLGGRIRTASRRSGRSVTLVSRSDSTLRGHFPSEVDALAGAAGVGDAPILLMPYLGEAGRLTIDDVHYLVRDREAVPVGETEFARDAVFGYRESNLREWVVGKLADAGAGAEGGRSIEAIGLDAIRTGGPDAVADVLRAAPPRSIVIANAADDRDAEVVAAAMVEAERERPVIARTAAGYVRARAGQPLQPPIDAKALPVGPAPGLVVVGSHVPTTTRQLAALLADPPAPLELVEVPADAAADPRRGRPVVRAAVARAAQALERGVIPVVATSRELLPPDPRDPTGLRAGARVSSVLARIVRELEPRPAWIIAKGGITSSDVASLGLGASEALVLGPLIAGVPAWRVARGSRRSVVLAVFPGNVGDDQALRSVVGRLSDARLKSEA